MSEIENKELPFGHSQFSAMSREQLQLHCERMFSTLVSAGSVMRLSRVDGPVGYWGPHGSGGQALEKLEQAMKLAEVGGSAGELHHSFYRYADELLFESPPNGTLRWSVCAKCNDVLGYRQGKEQSLTGVLHREISPRTDFDGVFRAYSWADLGRPKGCSGL
jgi:hypothetical protein